VPDKVPTQPPRQALIKQDTHGPIARLWLVREPERPVLD
jgi:hypothetical protein